MNTMRHAAALLAAVVGCAALSAAADTLAEYTFRAGGVNTTSPTTVKSGIAATAVTAGSGVTSLGFVLAPDYFHKGEALNAYNGSNIENGPDLNDYFQFALGTVSGTMSLDGLSFKYVGEDGSAPRRLQVRYSLTGFASDSGTIVVPTTVVPTAAVVTSSTSLSALPALRAVSGNVAFRIYFWGALSSKKYGAIDDVLVTGSLPPAGTVITLR